MSQPFVSINVGNGLDRIVADLGGTAVQIDRALKSSVRKLQGWMNTQLARELSQAVDIGQVALKRRMRKSAVRSGREIYASIWIGVNPIEAQRAGKPRQLKAGAKVRGRLFEKGFIASIFSPEQKIWRRTGKERFPVIKMTIPIAEELEKILPRYEGPAAAQFEKIFSHELKFAMGWFK